MSQQKNIEAIYPLAPMQQGMLYHAIAAPGTGDYINQLNMTLPALQVDCFKRAWQLAVERHPILRTLFFWEGRPQPLQVVRKTVALKWTELDLREQTPAAQDAQLAALLLRERRQDFVLTEAPLMRLTLVRRAEESHEFIWTYHHLITDGWSLANLFKEIFTLYESARTGAPPRLSTPRPFGDYIAWLQKQNRKSAEAFWRGYLKGFAAPTPLVVPSLPTLDGETAAPLHGEQSVLFPPALLAELRTVARAHELTLNTLFMGAWGLLLSRYSGETDVVFGTVVAGRPPTLAGVEEMVGVFINTLPLRIQVDEDAALSAWLKALQQQQVDRERYGYAALMDIQKWSELPAGTRLFENVAVFENYPIAVAPGGQAERVQVSAVDQTSLPLELLILLEEKSTFKLGYDPQRFTAETMARLAAHYQTLLQSMARDLGQRLRDLQMVTAAEQHELHIEWNATTTAYPREQTIHALFEQQVRHSPDAMAVRYGSEQLTYAELNRRANRLARHLQQLGVRPGPDGGPLVGLCVERSLDMIVGMLAILKAGGAYVPLEPEYPQARLAFLLSDTQAPIVLTQARWLDKLPATAATYVALDRLEAQLAAHSCEDLMGAALPTGRAYVIYTSGSSGQPKGVVVSHRAVNRLVKHTDYVQLTATDRIAQAANAAFDAATFEIWGALLNGAQLWGLERDDILSPPQLVAKLRDQGITTLFLTTALFNQVVSLIPDAFSSLRYLLFGGEAVDPGAVRRVLRHGRPIHFLHVYGPTENTTFSTWHAITELSDAAKTVPIGRPISNSQAYILDRLLRPVPIGVTGELYVAGDGLAEEYLHRPELTAKAFIHACIAPASTATRLYRTGDLARFCTTAGGSSGVGIEFVRRADNQIKLRGFRVEPGEIEAVLGQHPQVREAAVIVNEDAGGRRLVAYVIQSPQCAETAPALRSILRSYVQQHLPDYMVPAAFVIEQALPLSPNGKVDRRALAARRIDPQPAEHFAAAQTAIESTLVGIWQDVLRVAQVGIHDNFFELGGDSIISIQLVSRARKAGLHITAKQVFQKRTIAELALVATSDAGPAQPAQSLVTGEVALTPIQRWFFAEKPANPHHFNQSTYLEVAADISPALLRQVLQKLLVHHDALRLRYTRTSAGWQQSHGAAPSEVSLAVSDLSELPAAEQDLATTGQIAALQESLNIEDGPLLRAALFVLGAQRPARLFITIHHLAVDGVSWRILLEDLQTAYGQLSSGEDIVLPAKTTSFQAWAHWLTQQGAAQMEPQLAGWLARLPAVASALPQDQDAGANTVATALHVTRALSAELTRALLQEAPAAYHTQVNDLLLTALMQTVTDWTKEDTLLLALESHGREELHTGIDLSRTVGWFTTLYPVYLTLAGMDEDVGSAIKSIKEQLRQIPNSGIGYGILRYLSESPALAQLPEPQLSFNYMGQFGEGHGADAGIIRGPAAGSCEPEVSPQNNRARLLDVSGIVVGGRLEIDFAYSASFHRQATMERLITRYMDALMALIEHCCAPSAGGYTPSDFPESRLGQAALDQALAAIALENAS